MTLLLSSHRHIHILSCLSTSLKVAKTNMIMTPNYDDWLEAFRLTGMQGQQEFRISANLSIPK